MIHQKNTKRHKSMSSSATAYTLGVRTRAQKRRMGERDLWDLIVNNDDICFTHILPRLNSNDLKFLHGVNSETRKLIKRSSRTWELKKKFKVNEMSSISTLEFAWENRSLWPRHWRKDETSQSLGHNDLCSHANSKVDIDDISYTLNPFFNTHFSEDL